MILHNDSAATVPTLSSASTAAAAFVASTSSTLTSSKSYASALNANGLPSSSKHFMKAVSRGKLALKSLSLTSSSSELTKTRCWSSAAKPWRSAASPSARAAMHRTGAASALNAVRRITTASGLMTPCEATKSPRTRMDSRRTAVVACVTAGLIKESITASAAMDGKRFCVCSRRVPAMNNACVSDSAVLSICRESAASRIMPANSVEPFATRRAISMRARSHSPSPPHA
mmetsp:Transcript_774/g.2387  ORF Transcript_774/g.2387 Transcript_774/m.2387 type:complete len:230 (-) Transcript_774:1365-2054(-)